MDLKHPFNNNRPYGGRKISMVVIKNYSWRELQEVLPVLTEKEAFDLMQFERLSAKRQMVLKRLHQKFTILRAKRERKEILSDAIGE